jgi:hypothetical protein
VEWALALEVVFDSLLEVVDLLSCLDDEEDELESDFWLPLLLFESFESLLLWLLFWPLLLLLWRLLLPVSCPCLAVTVTVCTRSRKTV